MTAEGGIVTMSVGVQLTALSPTPLAIVNAVRGTASGCACSDVS